MITCAAFKLTLLLSSRAWAKHSHEYVIGQRAAKSAVTTSTYTTTVPITTEFQAGAATTATVIPGQLTMTFGGPIYLYIETHVVSTRTTVLTVATSSISTSVPKASVTVAVSATTTSKSLGPSSSSTHQSSLAKLPTASSKAPTTTTTSNSKSTIKSTSQKTSTDVAGAASPMCAETLEGSVDPKYTITSATYINDPHAPDCKAQCLQDSSCKSFSVMTRSGGFYCGNYNASVSTLIASGQKELPPGPGQPYMDVGCVHNLPSNATCSFETDGPTTAGQKYFIIREWPYGSVDYPCYHGCKKLAGCQSYFWEGGSSDAEDNPSSICSYYSAPVSKVFAQGYNGWTASDAACVPGLDY